MTHSPVLSFPLKSSPKPRFLRPTPHSGSNHYINYRSPVNNIFNINVNSNVTLSSPNQFPTTPRPTSPFRTRS